MAYFRFIFNKSLSDLVENGTGYYPIYETDTDVTIDAGKNSKYHTVYFRNLESIEDLEYAKDGKNLIIINGEQKVVLENYFTTKTGFDTKSKITCIDDEYGYLEIIGDNLINSASLGYVTKPNKKNVITGTVFHDEIDMSSSTKKKGYTINAKDGDDIITGSAKNDKITGGAGNDIIKTNGGNDTVVLTDNSYGEDIIDSTGSEKVTVKLSSFNENNLNFDIDNLSEISYSINSFSNFTYQNFNTTAADLWIQAGKKKYNIVNKTDETVDYTKNKSNKVVILSSDNAQTYNGSKKGVNVIYSNNQDVTYNYNGANDKYISFNNSDDSYSAKITKSTKLIINDEGGEDTITLKNTSKDISLFFNAESIDPNGDLVIYNKNAMTYNNLTKAVKSNTYTGGINIQDYFDDGKMETAYLGTEKINLENWAYYVNCEVSDYLEKIDYTNTNAVFKSGTKAQKKALINLFKSLTYEKYQNVLSECIPYTDYLFIREGDDLVYTAGDKTERVDFFFATGDLSASYYALDENGNIKLYDIYSDNNYIKRLKNNEELSLSDSDLPKTIYTNNNAANTIIFNDKKYSDFYTQSGDDGDDGSKYYAGDSLIYKSENDLIIGDLTVKDVDGYNSEIKIVDENEATKTIKIGTGTIDGTFESEIIIGSNADDIINPMGGNDLIYTGEGNDTLNFTAGTSGDPTGNNTAHMIGIGGTELLDTNPVSAISVYDAGGDDTYNTSFDVGLYIEDYDGSDTLNITDDAENLMYFFDVAANPNATGTPTLYTDLFICDKSKLMALANDNAFLAKIATDGLEALQGNLGYVWIDDYYGGTQKIETVNHNDTELKLDYKDTTSPLYQIRANVQAWLTNPTSMYLPEHTNYDNAWSVIEGGNMTDIKIMLAMYAR